MRLATPLEEVNRTWNKPPSTIEMVYNKELIERFADPDGDDAAYRDYVLKKKATRKELIRKKQEAAAKA